MFRPQIQKTRVLFSIAILNLALVYIAATSKEYIPKAGLEQKLKATEIMENSLELLYSTSNNIKSEDIYESGVLGVESSSITTIFDSEDKKMKNSKIACTHPNFAALVVEMFQEAQLTKDDKIAISMTGSLPGANIAVLSACKSMDLNPVIISSVGSSAWGANEEDFSWLDIEKILYENKIFDMISIASSIGGENDLGDNLSDKGIEAIENIIASKNVEFINNKNLMESVSKKIEIYNSKDSNYKAFVNIGGGSASLGYGLGKDSIKVGVIYPIEKKQIYYDGFENSIAKYFLDNDVTFINIKSINLLAKNVGLYPPDKSIGINEGPLFYIESEFNLYVIIICLLLSIVSIGGVGIYSHYEIKKRMQEYEPDSII
tara:strand:+ start:838 stop:1962 length:1125 start_codon:yes stop_codon:yes gene_type:complete